MGKLYPSLKNQRALGHDVQFIRMDNATENLTFKERAENDGMGLIFEITTPNTPQQNGIVESSLSIFDRQSQSNDGRCRF